MTGGPDASARLSVRTEWSRNWPTVAAATVGYGVSVIHIYSLGVMIAPLEAEFGWSRTQITSGYAIVATVVFLLSSVVGLAIDRFGPRRLALIGVITYSGAIALLSLAQQAVWTWWLLWSLVGAGTLFLKPTVWVAAISSLFHTSRGVALAVALSASGIVSSALPFLTHLLVENVGWRAAYLLWGVIAAALALPTVYFCFTSAIDRERVMAAKQVRPPAPRTQSAGIGKHIKSPIFVKLTAVSCIMAMIFSALIVGLIPILTATGITKANAAAIAGVVGITQILGRLSSGFLLDRFDARQVTAIIVCFPVVTCLVPLLLGGSVPAAIVAALFFGLSVGAELDAIAYLASRYFGIDNFGLLFGTLIGVTALGGGMGPFVASLVYDMTGSYSLVLWSIIPLSLLCAGLLMSLASYSRSDAGA